jgi:DNA polymerase-3 subunit epsilon
MFDFDEKTLYDVPIVVIDTETTGLFPGLGNRVVEVAAIRFEKWQAVGQMSQLVQPGRHMEPKATQVCGITDDDLVGQPSFGAVADELLELIDGALLVAHNAAFDASFLSTELFLAQKYDRAQPTEPILPNPWLCTLLLARQYFHFGRNNLGYIARQLNVRMGVAHRALNDVYMTAEVLRRMDRQLTKQGIYTVGDLIYAQGEPIYTPPPPQIPLPEPIDHAVAASKDLEILYFGKDGQTERHITPRYAAHHRGHDYLIAYCHLRQEQRSFRLDRIFSASLLDNQPDQL